MTTSDDFSDSVYQPDTEGGQEGEREPDMDNALGEPGTDDILDAGYSPPEKPQGTGFGTTADEQRQGEPLDLRLAQEEPDVWERPDATDGLGDTSDTDGELLDDQVGGARSGRLVAPDEGAHPDSEATMVAADVGIDGGAASAEEAAMHVVEEPEPL